MENLIFKDAKGGQLRVREVIREIEGYMKAAPGYKYAVVVGTDSEAINDGPADFVTAIVVRRIGAGGRYFWRRFKVERIHNLRERIINEVMVSIEAARMILKAMKEERVPENFSFEVHVDVGENGETKDMIAEVTGMIRAYNFIYRVKPVSYAASSLADRHV